MQLKMRGQVSLGIVLQVQNTAERHLVRALI